MTTAQQFIDRARLALRQGVVYHLGAGAKLPRGLTHPGSQISIATLTRGLSPQRLAQARAAGFDDRDPSAKLPACDCSGYVCWALEIARESTLPGYRLGDGAAGAVFTDSMFDDALREHSLFAQIPAAEPGCVVIFRSPGTENGTRIPGHVGIVTQVAGDDASRVLHCSATNSMGFDAIQETDPAVFVEHASIYAWPTLIATP